MNDNRRIRVFISSTFRDMMGERDELMTHAWPELRRFCSERQVELVEVDLRWGIAEEQSTRKETLKLCLDEIRACRPFFIGLLGERYGWTPGDDAFTTDLKEEQPWLADLHGKSVTELEILHGVLNNPEMAGRAFFYFRDPKYVESVLADKKTDFTAEDAKSAEKQKQLKILIRQTCARKKIPLRENFPDPVKLAVLVLKDLKDAIEAQFPIENIPDALTREARDHEAFAETRRRTYIGRPDYFEALDRHATGDGTPLVLLGDSGSGKSALLANWLAHWHTAHPKDFIFQHYIGGTPDSAEHWRLMTRLIAEIKRWTDDPEELPKSRDDLLKTFPVWLAKARIKAERDDVRCLLVLDALNQLEDHDHARLLDWLPTHPFTGALRLLVSTLPGDTLDAVTPRGWKSLCVESLSLDERRRMMAHYLARFGKKLDAPRLERIAAAPAAANPLYLKILLDELRVTGTYDRLDERLDNYLAATDIPLLLRNVLERYRRDYERDRPGLVGEALGLIWAARRGLTETELLQLMKPADLPQLPLATWAPMRAALEEGLVDRGGIINFAYNYLRKAVEAEFVSSDDLQKATHLAIADYFERNEHQHEMTSRKAEEWPYQLHAAEAWDRLEACLTDIPLFLALCNDKTKWELSGYWQPLRARGRNMGSSYEAAFQKSISIPDERLLASLESATGIRWSARSDETADYSVPAEIGFFLVENGQYSTADQMLRCALKGAERVLGPTHPNTVKVINNLASLLGSTGDLTGAEQLFHRALEANERVLGLEHPDTLVSLNNLASLLQREGNYAGAESLYHRALETQERILGQEHPDTLVSVNNLANLLGRKGDYAGAELLFRRALKGFEHVVGSEHPFSIVCLNNLAHLLGQKGDYLGAEQLCRRALEGCERVFGPEHPHTLTAVNALARILMSREDYARAEPLCRRALEGHERVFGTEHTDTLTSVDTLAELLRMKGDYGSAEPLFRRALKGNEHILGPEHPDTLGSVNNLARLLQSKGDYVSAEPLFHQALKVCENVLGPEHPDTLTIASNLAVLLNGKGDLDAAEPIFRRTILGFLRISRNIGREHPTLQIVANGYMRLLMRRGMSQEQAMAHVQNVQIEL